MKNELIIPDFTPETDLDEYTSRPRGGDGLAFLYLTEDWYWSKVFKPLDFFNLLYEQVGIAIANRANPVLLKKHLLNLKLTQAQKLYLFKFLSEHLNDRIRSNKDISNPLDYENIRMLIDCTGIIDKEYSKLLIDIYESEDKQIDNPNNRFDYAREMKHLKTLADKDAKHEYLNKLLDDYTSNVGTWEEKKRWNGESFLGMMTRKRDAIKREMDDEIGNNTEQPFYEQNQPENDLLRSTIVEYLSDFESIINKQDFEILTNALKQYFETDTFPVLQKVIKVGRINKKRFGWVLNELFRCEKGNSKLTIEYLKFAKNNISLFIDVEFDQNNMMNSTLYKYFTTRTQ